MAKSNGIKDLKQAAKLLNKHAPKGESLAYINPREARILKAHGGSGIETLSGVPSYWEWFDTAVEWVGDKAGSIVDWGADLISDRYTGKGALGNVAKDAFSVWAGLKAKKDQEGLNEHEMAQFNKLNQQLAAAETEFNINVAGGPAVTNVPDSITDVASYTDVTLPALKTTAVAEGGRIGYSSGTENGALKKTYNKVIQRKIKMLQGMKDSGIEISAEDDKWLQEHTGQAQGGRIGYNFGGIGALNPRMSYQDGTEPLNAAEMKMFNDKQLLDMNMNWGDADTNVFTAKDRYFDENPLFAAKHMERVSDAQKYWDEQEGAALFDQAMIMVEKGLARDLSHALQLLRGEMNQTMGAAHGGRIGAKEGGIMPLLNLGGMEKDYRQDGGFVPIGRREKADDVPARLSKNEFVFTADAVRNAGGGDIDKGAQRMYNVMKNLEAGGEISEQSQGQV